MKNEDLEKRFRCGPVEAAYENSKWFSVFMKVLFLMVAIYFFWLMMGEQHLSSTSTTGPSWLSACGASTARTTSCATSPGKASSSAASSGPSASSTMISP